MQKHERESLEAIQAVINPVGLEVSTKTGVKKSHLVVVVHSRPPRTYAISSSPTHKCMEHRYAERWAKRLVRELGLTAQ